MSSYLSDFISNIAVMVDDAVALPVNSIGARELLIRAETRLRIILELNSNDVDQETLSSISICALALLNIIHMGTTHQEIHEKLSKTLSDDAIPISATLFKVNRVNLLFDAIIGSSYAKFSLHENVILPLTMETNVYNRLFCGIRAGSSNVILYGPPGT